MVYWQTDMTAMTKAMEKTGVSRRLFPLGRMNRQKLLDARQLLAQLQYVMSRLLFYFIQMCHDINVDVGNV